VIIATWLILETKINRHFAIYAFVAIFIYCAVFTLSPADIRRTQEHRFNVSGVIVGDGGEGTVKISVASVNGNYFQGELYLKTSSQCAGKSKDHDHIDLSNIKISRYKTTRFRAVPDDQSQCISRPTVISSVVKRLKDYIKNTSHKHYRENAPIHQAMVFGLDDELTSEDKKVFRDLGLGHILVASGANIIMILAALEFLFQRIQFRGSKLIEFSIVFLYFLLVGFQGSMIRAFVFFVITRCAEEWGREVSIVQKAIMTILIIALIFPGELAGLSFILSFVATISLFFVADLLKFLTVKSVILTALLQNILLISLINLVTAVSFRSFNMSGIFANLLILPLVEVIVTSGFVLMIVLPLLDMVSLDLLTISLAKIHYQLLALFNYLVNLGDNLLSDHLDYTLGLNKNIVLILYLLVIIAWIIINYRNTYYKADNNSL
jgi:ComEC/Rec2-related protein